MKSAYNYYVDTQDGSALPDLHATSSGLKALVTQVRQLYTVANGGEGGREANEFIIHAYSTRCSVPTRRLKCPSSTSLLI